MRTLTITLTALIAVTNAQMTTPPLVPTVSGCPAVLSVTALCPTCVTLACIETAYVTAGCDGCPSPPATVFTGYPCEDNCAGLGGCKTEYRVVTAAEPGECESAPATVTQSEPETVSLPPYWTESGSTGTDSPGEGTAVPTTTGEGSEEPPATQTTLTGTVTESSSSTAAGPVSTNAAGRLRPWRLW